MTGKNPTDWDIFNCTLVHNLPVNGLILWRERPHKREDDDRPTTDDDDDARISCSRIVLVCQLYSAVFQGRGRGRTRETRRRRRQQQRGLSRIVLVRQLSLTGERTRTDLLLEDSSPSSATHHVRIFRGRFLCPRSTVVNRERMRTKTTTTTTTTQDTRDWNCIACRRGESNFS